MVHSDREAGSTIDSPRDHRDLFYRLNVFPIEVPSLRERRDDIPLLVWSFINGKQAEFGKTIEAVHLETMELLQRYPWPGNVRELENVVERALIITAGSSLMVDPSFGQEVEAQFSEAPEDLDTVERRHILTVLGACDWKIKGRGHAAERLGLNESTLRSRMKKLGIERHIPTSSSSD